MVRMATNKVSSLVGKLETEVHIKASAEEFYHMFVGRPYLVSDASPTNIQGCDLLDGEWGTSGSTILWNYVLDGKEKVTKDMIETVDPEKKLITLRIIEGDLMEEFKNLLLTVHVTPNPKGPGSIVHGYIEYEKISEEVADPEALLQLGVALFKEMDKNILSEQ